MLQRWNVGGISLLLCAALFSTGCTSSSAHLRLANAIPSQSGLTLLVDGANDANSVAYGTASAYISVNSGSRHVQIEPAGSANDILIDQNVSVSSGNTTVIAVSSAGTSGGASSLVLSDQTSTPASSDIAIRAVNASLTLGTADIYIVPSTTDISTVNPTASSVAYPSATSYSTVAAGTYVVIFTQPGSKTPMITSSPLGLVAGQVRTVLGLTGQSGGFTTGVLADLN